MPIQPGDSESKFERTISFVLFSGVLASLFLIAAGITVFFVSHGHLSISESGAVFIRGENFFNLLYRLVQGRDPQEKAFLLITWGIMVLILTPYVRVIVSALHFIWIKDIKYTLFTLFVLIILTLSLTIH
jgi:uncharacterized membrane protein